MIGTERRLSRRLNLRWRLKLTSAAFGTIESRTENLSSRGFYCFLDAPLPPGEVVTCTITLPDYMGSSWFSHAIVCQAEVIRIEAAGSSHGFGVAWRIIDFMLERRENSSAAWR